jgi:hypothetical protein
MKGEPPDYQKGFMHSVEKTVSVLGEEFPKLHDKDVEFVYQALKDYFKKSAQGTDCEEPLSTIERRQALMDEILNSIDTREDMEADFHVVQNPNILLNGTPIANLPILYATCFNRLVESVRFWRKERGNRGYLSFIKEVM